MISTTDLIVVGVLALLCVMCVAAYYQLTSESSGGRGGAPAARPHSHRKAPQPPPAPDREPGLSRDDADTLAWLRSLRPRGPGWTMLALRGRLAVLGALLDVPGRDGKRSASPQPPTATATAASVTGPPAHERLEEPGHPAGDAPGAAMVAGEIPAPPLVDLAHETAALGDLDAPCPVREDREHCWHWHDGGECCACGDPAMEPGYITHAACPPPAPVLSPVEASLAQIAQLRDEIRAQAEQDEIERTRPWADDTGTFTAICAGSIR